MKKQRMTLLAGIAALALIAGAGAAAAQQTGTDEHGGKQPSAASHEMNKWHVFDCRDLRNGGQTAPIPTWQTTTGACESAPVGLRPASLILEPKAISRVCPYCKIALALGV